MKLKKCFLHNYTLKDTCPVCGKESSSAHYKFLRFSDVKYVSS